MRESKRPAKNGKSSATRNNWTGSSSDDDERRRDAFWNCIFAFEFNRAFQIVNKPDSLLQKWAFFEDQSSISQFGAAEHH
jgi:hypothetical protein